MVLIPEKFLHYKQHLQQVLSPEAIDATSLLIKALPDGKTPANYFNLGKAFSVCYAGCQQQFDHETFLGINRLLITELVLRLPQTIKNLTFTEEVRALYPAMLERIADYLMQEHEEPYYFPHEYFTKDIRLAAGLSVPCGSRIIDVCSIIDWSPNLPLLTRNTAGDLFKFLCCFKKKPWFRAHVELRHLEEFNAIGVDRYHRRVASLISLYPEVHGFIGSSWYYDIKLEHVSPHLRFLWQPILDGGGFIMRGATSEYNIKAATGESVSRQKMYKEGKYTPTGCLFIWPRAALLNWAESTEPL